ncbi:glycosyltransferase family 87 protein [Streptomyces sp. NPDC007172]|uniref:glycosyltransferase family 87 protein n=1 Tax=Streptomyces sp. NPDC007172 TaxID=3364776 RepID=UPI0036CB8DA3
MTHGSTLRPVVRTGVLLAALTAVLALTVLHDGYNSDPGGLSWWYAASWLLFALAAWSLRKVPARGQAALIVAGGIAIAATGLLAPPRTSTDSYRYAWDGRVQAAGISPYDHAPRDRELTGLRDPWLFPTDPAQCALPDHARVDGGCTRLNRPSVHTIYPPVAEAYFLLVDEISPGSARIKPLQIGGALCAVGTTLVLVRILRRRRGTGGEPGSAPVPAAVPVSVAGAAYWAWCPALPVEAVNNAHVDVLAVLLTVAGIGVLTGGRGTQRLVAPAGAHGTEKLGHPTGGHGSESAISGLRAVLGGALIGAGVAVKMLPAVVLPAVLRRRPVTVLLSTVGLIALSYLPYVLASHSSVFGYLGGYTEEEGYDDPAARGRFALLRLALPPSWSLPVTLVVLLALTAYVLRRGRPERPWAGALSLLGSAFLLLTPGYSWYALLLVALVALDGRWEWLTVAGAGAASYVTARAAPGFPVATTAYAIAAGAVLTGCVLRLRRRPEYDADPAEARSEGRVSV